MKKKPATEHPQSEVVGMSEIERILKRIQLENEMIDDYGSAIIGGREGKPNLRDSDS